MIDDVVVAYFRIDKQTLFVARKAHAHTTIIAFVHEFKRSMG